MIRKVRAGKNNRKYANIIIACWSNISWIQKFFKNYINYIIWFMNTKLHRVINTAAETKIHT